MTRRRRLPFPHGASSPIITFMITNLADVLKWNGGTAGVGMKNSSSCPGTQLIEDAVQPAIKEMDH